MSRLAGKVAVVVGAGQTAGETVGNGRAVAITFAREGARLLLVDRDAASLKETRSLLQGPEADAAETLGVDIASAGGAESVVARCVEVFGRLDVLHNNVGIAVGDASPTSLTEEAWDRIVDVNLKATWRTCKAAVLQLRAQGDGGSGGGGSIVNISSVAAIAAAGNLTAYKISKAGVNALTQNLAVTNARYGIRVNAIMPGLIDTPMAVDAVARSMGVTRDEVASARAARVPLRHQGTAWDVANAALFLASDEAAFITGVCLAVDGGQSAMVG